MSGGEQESTSAPIISVRGGAGGHYALTEDLKRAVGALNEARDAVHRAQSDMRVARGYAQAAVGDAVWDVRPCIIDAQRAVEDVLLNLEGFHDVIDQFNSVSGRLAAVAQSYEDAEAAAYQGLSLWTRMGRGISASFGLGLWFNRTLIGNALRLSPLDWAPRLMGRNGIATPVLPEEFPAVTGFLNGASVAAFAGLLDRNYGLAGNAYENTLLLLSRSTAFLEWWSNEPKYAGVDQVGEQGGLTPPRGVADLVRNIDTTAKLDHGGVTIDTIVNADGTVSHIVNIPGTDDHSFSDKSTRDWNSNFKVTGDKDSDAARMVRDALEAAGIGPDEPIMLQGHSQGGGVAAYLAASDLQEEFSISHVVTFGSAPDRLPVRDDVSYLHVVTTQDVTPGADGMTAPDLPNVVTVEADLLAAQDPAAANWGTTVTGAHSLNAYHDVAKSLDGPSHASIEAWRDGASDFFGEGQMSRQHFAPIFEENRPVVRGGVGAPADGQWCQRQPLFGPGPGHGFDMPTAGYKPALPDWLHPTSTVVPDVRDLVNPSVGGA